MLNLLLVRLVSLGLLGFIACSYWVWSCGLSRLGCHAWIVGRAFALDSLATPLLRFPFPFPFSLLSSYAVPFFCCRGVGKGRFCVCLGI
ncbi:hypothetical protein F4861DRAFT_505754 [Xylaria intraflava]|nr:hypothetical protein F4861DRAFT_505754 [Xylaria intraflava]